MERYLHLNNKMSGYKTGYKFKEFRNKFLIMNRNYKKHFDTTQYLPSKLIELGHIIQKLFYYLFKILFFIL